MGLRMPKGRSILLIAAVLLLAGISLVASEVYSAALTATAEPLQNATSDGSIRHEGVWSAASEITRHESSDLTINGSDVVTDVAVQGTKTSGAVDILVKLLDATATVVDNVTISLSTASGSFTTPTTVLTAQTVGYHTVARVRATYTSAGGSPTNITLDATDAYDEKNLVYLLAEATLSDITISDDVYFQLDSPGGTPGYFLSVQYDQTVPTGATINSVKIYIEHWEDSGYGSGQMTWEVGTGTLSGPTVLGSTIPTVLTKEINQAVVEWDVSSIIDTEAEANDIKVKIINNSTNGKKVYVDHVYVIVNYTP